MQTSFLPKLSLLAKAPVTGAFRLELECSVPSSKVKLRKNPHVSSMTLHARVGRSAVDEITSSHSYFLPAAAFLLDDFKHVF